MTLSPDPLTTADTLWRRLAEHQPAVAAALAMQLREMPDTWAQRELGVARPYAALELPADDVPPVEIEPYDTAGFEDCPPCNVDPDRLCRYHEGLATGHDTLHRALLEAVRIDPQVTVRDVLLHLAEADEAEATGELATAVERLTEELG